jgi:hypothetical protein
MATIAIQVAQCYIAEKKMNKGVRFKVGMSNEKWTQHKDWRYKINKLFDTIGALDGFASIEMKHFKFVEPAISSLLAADDESSPTVRDILQSSVITHSPPPEADSDSDNTPNKTRQPPSTQQRAASGQQQLEDPFGPVGGSSGYGSSSYPDPPGYHPQSQTSGYGHGASGGILSSGYGPGPSGYRDPPPIDPNLFHSATIGGGPSPGINLSPSRTFGSLRSPLRPSQLRNVSLSFNPSQSGPDESPTRRSRLTTPTPNTMEESHRQEDLRREQMDEQRRQKSATPTAQRSTRPDYVNRETAVPLPDIPRTMTAPAPQSPLKRTRSLMRPGAAPSSLAKKSSQNLRAQATGDNQGSTSGTQTPGPSHGRGGRSSAAANERPESQYGTRGAAAAAADSDASEPRRSGRGRKPSEKAKQSGPNKFGSDGTFEMDAMYDSLEYDGGSSATVSDISQKSSSRDLAEQAALDRAAFH